jgi:diaminopimelate decarboxylase
MSSTYNARPLAPEVLVAGDEWGIVRARQDHDELIARDTIPVWLRD